MSNTLKICKTRNVKTPVRAHDTDAGIDFYVPENLTVIEMQERFKTTGHILATTEENGFITSFTLCPGESVLIPSGIKTKVPEGYMLQFTNKSGVATKRHLLVGANVVDVGYEGECHINLHNVGTVPQVINAGDKIVQAILIPVNFANTELVGSEDELFGDSRSARGAGGFGSSGNA